MVVGEFTQETDLVVIGGGPGGYSAAFRAAELGISTVIVDSHHALGGVCLHSGCIPSKTLLHIAEIIQSTKTARQFGVKYVRPKISTTDMRGWVSQTVRKLAGGLEAVCKKHGVEHIQGKAHFEDSRNLAIVDSEVPRIRFRRAIIATGSAPVTHPHLSFDNPHVNSPETALHLNELPETLLVVGGGYMAVELATIYAALHSNVILVHEGDRLLPDVDNDLLRPLNKQLLQDFKAIHLNCKVTGAKDKNGGLEINLSGGDAPKSMTVDEAIVAIGQTGLTDKLQLEKTQVTTTNHGFIEVDDQLRTTDPRIFAVGDVTGPPLLADKAIHQGRLAAETIAGENISFDARAIPSAIFTNPQIAWCGVTEDQAKAQGTEYKVAKIPWGASGRAVGMGRNDGITKIIYEPDSQIVLGVGITGVNACEMIAEGALAIEMGATLTDLASTIHPHPTLVELISDAARQVATD